MMDTEAGEVVYGSTINDDSHVMSERVQSLAASIYQEFERMIKKYDEDVVKHLMPLVVGILEALDLSYTEKQENEVELELLRDDNEQLLTQYEREKQLRKAAEQKYLEVEDLVECERREQQAKTESLESIVRMLELKARNAQDHITRLEDKEAEMKKEYTKLHERYTELFRTHMDHIERTKMFMGPDKMMELGVSPRSRSGFQMPVLRPVTPNAIYSASSVAEKAGSGSPGIAQITSPRMQSENTSLQHELQELEKGEMEEKFDSKEQKELMNKRAETAEKEQITDSIDVKSTSAGTNATSESAMSSEKHCKESSNTQRNEATILSDRQSTDTILHSGKECKEPVLCSDKKTDDDSAATNVCDTKTKAVSSESNDTECQLAELNDVMSKLSDSVQNLEATKAAYSIGISLDPEDFEEDTQIRSPADTVASPDPDGSSKQPKPVHTKRRANESSLFDELSLEDINALEDVDDGCDITGKVVNPGDYASADGDQDKLSSGMSKEVENLILENTELLATKNALNIVKDDLIAKVDELTSEQEILREEISALQSTKDKLRQRVTELEEEVKKLKEELDKERKNKGTENNEDEEDVPMAQRKRFTRVEMARVLMERNQYKERLMELQEAVRWTEMIRASRDHPDLVQKDKKRGSIWNFFSNLFSSSGSSSRPASRRSALPPATIKYSAPTTKVSPQGDPNKKHRDTVGDKGKAYDFLQDDLLAEKARKDREKERREQYKQVRAHVKKDDGRMQAYGWSLPAKFNPPINKETSISKSHVPVPVPVYCRPLLEKDEGMKLWCAAGVNLTGGKTKDGGSIVGASVFYNNLPVESTSEEVKDDIAKLDKELQEHQKGLKALEEENLSSLVWICTTLYNSSQVTVIDANNPGDILESFHATSSHILCIASVPGAMESDYPSADNEPIKCEASSDAGKSEDTASTSSADAQQADGNEHNGIGGIRLVQCVTGAASGTRSPDSLPGADDENGAAAAPSDDIQAYDPESDVKITYATGSPVSSASSTPSHSSGSEKRHLELQTELVKDGVSPGPSCESDIVSSEMEKMSSVLPTMWLGCQSGCLFVHSAVSQWKRCLHSVKLKDSVLNIVHLKGRVFVALADGTLAVFHRDTDGQWDLHSYHLVELGKPQHSIRCVSVVGNKHIWCGYRNKIHVINPKSLKLEKTFDAHPRKESQVRQLAWVGDGVWVSIRLDSTLRLYHAYTHQHLQDVDIEPYVSKMLGTGKLGFSFVRITSLLASCNRLWIGTGNGVVISVPLSESNKQSVTMTTMGRPGGIIRVYSDSTTDSVTPGTFLPYCTMAQAQLSFHGHRDAVKFFVAVPGAPTKGVSGVLSSPASTREKSQSPEPGQKNKNEKKTVLVLSGGEGYIDFRIGDTDDVEAQGDEQKKGGISKGEKSHLIVWQMCQEW